MLSLTRYYRYRWTTKKDRKTVGARAPIAISAEDKTQRLFCPKLIQKNHFSVISDNVLHGWQQ